MTVVGPVISARILSRARGFPTFVYIGKDDPDKDRFELVIWGRNLENFAWNPLEHLPDKLIAVTGTVSERDGVVRMEVDSSGQVVVQDLISTP